MAELKIKKDERKYQVQCREKVATFGPKYSKEKNIKALQTKMNLKNVKRKNQSNRDDRKKIITRFISN